MAVTPVLTGPFPTTSLPSPTIRVLKPTSTPGTSVMALTGPGAPSNGTPRSRARGSPGWTEVGVCALAARWGTSTNSGRTPARSKARSKDRFFTGFPPELQGFSDSDLIAAAPVPNSSRVYTTLVQPAQD